MPENQSFAPDFDGIAYPEFQDGMSLLLFMALRLLACLKL